MPEWEKVFAIFFSLATVFLLAMSYLYSGLWGLATSSVMIVPVWCLYVLPVILGKSQTKNPS